MKKLNNNNNLFNPITRSKNRKKEMNQKKTKNTKNMNMKKSLNHCRMNHS